jgi:hypothetical protein
LSAAKKFLFSTLALILAISLTGCNTPTTKSNTTAVTTQTTIPTVELTTTIPAEYQALYTELDAEMASFETTLKQKWDGKPGQPIIATELAYANGNVGPGLLTVIAQENNRILLDRLQAMGVKGVVLAIKFPLLKPDFPNSADYLQFYQKMMTECHARGMKVLVECGAIFSGTAYSPVQVDWSEYTTDSFLQGLQNQLVLVAQEIKPDYLTLANEPETEEALTKLTITPAVWSNFIAATLKRIDKSNGILLGAGCGTWENPDYINTLYKMSGLDYIDLHIYAMNRNAALLERGLNYAAQARAAGKRVTVSEAWLWKAAPEELGSGIASSDKIMNRDVFSFWNPLDERFFQDIVSLADATNMDFVSFFWTRNLFTGLDYNNTTNNLPTAEYNSLMNQTSISNVRKNKMSGLGWYYQQQLQIRAGK